MCCVHALCVVFCCGVSAGAVRSQVTKHGTCRQMLASRRLFWCEHDSGAGGLAGDGDGAPDDGDEGLVVMMVMEHLMMVMEGLVAATVGFLHVVGSPSETIKP